MVSLTKNVDSAVICIFLLNFVLGNKQSCDTSTVLSKQCSSTETCVPLQTTSKDSEGFCDCLPGHSRINNTYCKNVTKSDDPPTPKSSSLVNEDERTGSGHVVAGVLIPIFLITVVISGVYFSRKYHVVSYVRTKLYQRSNNYDEVMIGQDLDDDDPPLR